MKRIVKYCLAVIAYYSGLLYIAALLKRRFFSEREYLILTYHCFLDKDDKKRKYIEPGMIVSPGIFESQISYLVKRYKVVSLNNLMKTIRNKQPVPKNSVAITIDDGWQDNYLNAYPALKKHCLPATIFLTTDYIDTNKIFWFLQAGWLLAGSEFSPSALEGYLRRYKHGNELGRQSETDDYSYDSDKDKVGWFIGKLKKLDRETVHEIIRIMIGDSNLSLEQLNEDEWMLKWDMIGEMKNNGIDFGSHGCTHRILNQLDVHEIKKELMESRNIIESKIGDRVVLFSYPNGDYSSDIIELVREAGYECAVTTRRKKAAESEDDLYTMRRINVHEGISVGPGNRFSRAMFAFHLVKNM